MVLLHEEPDNEVTRASTPYPLVDLFERRASAFQTLDLAPWGPTEVQRYLDSKGLQGDAGGLARICSGRAGFIAEVTELLQERGELGGDLSGHTLAGMVPFQVDEDELDLPDGPPKEGERKHAGPADASTVAYFAALLGHAFPAGLVADMGGFDRDSVDDLLDAMSDLFEEVQFSQELGTWIYRFKRGTWREGILEQNRTESGLAQARQVALFIERYLMPRGYGFMPKAMRLYAENGAPNRATLVRAIQLANDAPDAWGLVFDLLRYFDEVSWPDPLRRTVYQHLTERMVAGGNPQMAEQVLNEATEFANRTKDRELSAALLLQGSRLDARRQDLFRARDRANDAIKLFIAQDLKPRAAEVHNHLAAIELSDGNLNAALEQINNALELGKVKTPDGQEGVAPAVFATATRLRGTIARRAGRLPEAAELFRRANEVAGQAGLASEALDSGLSYGEALLANRQIEPARDALERVFGIARSLNNPARERAAAELLAQAEGQLRNYDKALPLARRVLELSQQLRLDNLLVIDLYNLGFFTFLTQKPTEAVTLFRQSQARLGTLPANHPVHRELHYFFGVALLQTGALDEGIAALRKAVTLLRDANEPVKLASALEHLSNGYLRKGDKQNARAALDQAVTVARNAGLKDAKKELKRKLEELDGAAN
jgi:tetratricopeptide (TPR) repeat protein